MKKGILLCFHGTRNNEGVKDTLKLLKLFKKNYRNYTVKLGYLEINKITINKQLKIFFEKKISKLFIIPVMIFSGNHSSKDIPKIIHSVKKKYSLIPDLFITKPLIFSKSFITKIEKNLKNAIYFYKKKNIGLIVLASNTINIKAKKEIDLLTKRLANKYKVNYSKRILVGLDTNSLKKQLLKFQSKKDYFILVPIFLFRGTLFHNLKLTVNKLNKNLKNNKFKILPLIKNYEYILMSIKEQLKYIKKM